MFVYGSPKQDEKTKKKPSIPKPQVRFNLVVVKTPEALEGEKPIVVPPPQEKTLVYVLNKKQEEEEQELIKVPFEPQEPEVYYINYEDGENPTLPGGIDLQTALKSVPSQEGREVGEVGQTRNPTSNTSDRAPRPQSPPKAPSSLYGTPF